MNKIIEKTIVEVLEEYSQPHKNQFIAFINNMFEGNYKVDDIYTMIENIELTGDDE